MLRGRDIQRLDNTESLKYRAVFMLMSRKKPPTGRRKLEEVDEATLPVVRVPITDPLFEQLVLEGRAKRAGVETSGSATSAEPSVGS